MFQNRWWLFALLTNNYFCLLQCVCVKKCTILCVFCDFYCLSLFCGQQRMQNKRKNWKNKARTILIRKRVSKGNAEWHCDHNDVNNVTFCVSWLCTPLPCDVCVLWPTKHAQTQNQGKQDNDCFFSQTDCIRLCMMILCSRWHPYSYLFRVQFFVRLGSLQGGLLFWSARITNLLWVITTLERGSTLKEMSIFKLKCPFSS